MQHIHFALAYTGQCFRSNFGCGAFEVDSFLLFAKVRLLHSTPPWMLADLKSAPQLLLCCTVGQVLVVWVKHMGGECVSVVQKVVVYSAVWS